MQGVQRFLHGGNNKVRTAISLAGPVKPITDSVIQKPIARQGSTAAVITGTFTGTEEATYELEITNITPDTPLVTEPVFSGTGNGSMTNVDATGLSAREIVVTLADLGQILTAASADLQGVRVIMKTPGAAGNFFFLTVDRSGLIFTPQNFSLLTQLEEGTSAVTGPQYDWETVFLNADGTIPTTAKRIALGEDRNNIYVQYKKVVKGKTSYIFEPELAQMYPAKSQVHFVTGAYTVQLWETVAGTPILRETYLNIVTLYDLLNSIKSNSTRLQVQGAVANDRTSGGQALLEIALNTTARAVTNTGSGSLYATGFKDVVIEPNAPTELIEATCVAAKSNEAANASLGREIWEVRGSVSGIIRESAVSGDLISGAFYSFRIPQKLPEGYVSNPQGSFNVQEIIYNDRRRQGSEEDNTLIPPHPPICIDSRTLGINAHDMSITLTYKKRPVQDNCACQEDNAIALSPECLGVITESEGGSTMAYSAATIARLITLYDWFADTVRENSDYFNSSPNSPTGLADGGPYTSQDPFVAQPANNPNAPKRDNYAYVSLFDMVKRFESTLAEVDKLGAGALRTAAEDAWDDAYTEFTDDVDTHLSGAGVSPVVVSEAMPAHEALAQGDAVAVFDIGGVKKIRKALAGGLKYGWVAAAYASGATATINYYGTNEWVSSTEETVNTNGVPNTWKWYPSVATPGKWVKHRGVAGTGDPLYINSFSMDYVNTTTGVRNAAAEGGDNVYGYSLIADRYIARLQWVLISGGISPLGKSDADTGGGDGCWRDAGGDFWWEVKVGNELYAPAFTGVPYYSAKKYPGGVTVGGVTTPSEGYYSTKEFGFILDIPCKQNLVIGDQVVLSIGQAGTATTYTRGDKLSLGIVAGQNIAFLGGKDGDNVQTWHVNDSVSGARAPYLLDTDAPLTYNTAGISFFIDQGPIPFVKGDSFSFAIEGGNFRWRKTVGGVVGAWSADLDVVKTPIALDSGLSLQFEVGAAPALFAGDFYRFVALQPYAISNIQKPDFDMWQWGNTSPAPATIDLGAATTIEAIAIAFHTIPDVATILVEGGVAVGVYTWSEPITWRKDIIAQLLATPRTARYIRVTITNGNNGGIGWLYAGIAQAFTHSAQVRINRRYEVKRSDGINPASLFRGRAVGSEIQWAEGHLLDEDYDDLVAMVDYLKENDDEPFMFFPQYTRPDIILATVEADEIVFNDVFNFQPNSDKDRRLSCTIPLRGVAMA